jgi:DNA polymerase II small subunit/DNA polymerase delta subunit B
MPGTVFTGTVIKFDVDFYRSCNFLKSMSWQYQEYIARDNVNTRVSAIS